MKYSDRFRTAAAVALSIIVAAVPAIAKNGNPKVAKPMAGSKAKAPRVQAAKAPSAQAPRATTQKPQVSSVTAPKSNTRPTTSARRSSTSRFFADPASGFKNSGQYRATVNNANNLGLDFWLLKDLMVNQGMSLGQAKKPAKAMDAGQAVRRGNATVVRANTAKPSTTSPPTTSITPRRRPGNSPVIQANTDRPPTTSRKVKDKS